MSRSVLLAVAIAAGGCVIVTDDHVHHVSSSATIDEGRTLTAAPGDGVGVFVSYEAGGRWTIQWTCDTNVTYRACDFDIWLDGHAIGGLQSWPAMGSVNATSSSLHARARTTNTLDGLSFVAYPGSSIVLSTYLAGSAIPSLTFFVSNDRLVTAGAIPMELVPSRP